MSALRNSLIFVFALLLTTGVASAQYGYAVQGPQSAGMGMAQPPPGPSYVSNRPTMDPNMGMGTQTYGGPSYTGQQNYYPPPQGGMGMSVPASQMLTYGQLEVDYLRTTYANKRINASDGAAISLMAQLFNPLYLHFGVNLGSGQTASVRPQDYNFSTVTLGAGGYIPVTSRFHLTGEIGFLYASLDTSRTSISFSDGAIYMMPGARFAATDNLELDAHLTATSADNYDSFIFDIGGYYRLFSQMDLGLNVGFGDASTTYKAGIRFRW